MTSCRVNSYVPGAALLNVLIVDTGLQKKPRFDIEKAQFNSWNYTLTHPIPAAFGPYFFFKLIFTVHLLCNEKHSSI